MSNDEILDINSVLDSCLVLILEQGMGVEDCLERFPQHKEELQRLLPVALRLSQSRLLTASDELRASLAARLQGISHPQRQNSPGFFVTNLAALRSIFRNRNSIPQRRAWMTPILVSFLIVAVLSMGGLVASADAAGPGDLLFGLDTAIEDVRLSFTNDEEKETELRIEFATERLEELKIEIEGEGDRHHIEEALAMFEEALAAIEELLGELSPEQRAAFEEALAILIALSGDLDEFEFEFELEDGRGELKLEIESGDDLDDDDLDDDDLDDDDLDDDDLDDDDLDNDDDEDCNSSGPGSDDCKDDDDDEDDEDCDSSGPGSDDCKDDDDDEDEECESSGSGSGDDCDDDHDDDDVEDEDDDEKDDD